MGKRHVDHDTSHDTTSKRRKTEHAITNIDSGIGEHFSQDALNVSYCSDIVYSLNTDVVDGVILTDLCAKQWRCGKPIGKGSFGEIFLASDDIDGPVTEDNANYVVKIEPHKSGPLFVEIHCLIKAGKATEERPLPLGMPTYVASGGHYFGDGRYRFLILPRYDFDLHSIIRNQQLEKKNILIIADQLIDILEHIHDSGYAHSDIKAENIMIGKCTYSKSKNGGINTMVPATDTTQRNGDSTKQHKANCKANNKTTSRTRCNGNKKSYAESECSSSGNKSDDSDFNDAFDRLSNNGNRGCNANRMNGRTATATATASTATSARFFDEEDSDSSESTSSDFKPSNGRRTTEILYSGSNPVRSCRMNGGMSTTKIYEDMVRTHYLRRSAKKVNYCEDEEMEDGIYQNCDAEDDEWGRKNKYLKRIYLSPNRHVKAGESASRDVSPVKREEHETKPIIDPIYTEDRIHLIDFGLALKFIDANGVHRPFVMDQRRAHDGTLEFTSRDAHMGAHSRRSDLECLAYNLIFWQEGFLPWKSEKIMSQPEQVHRMKEYFMTDIKELYNKIYNVPIPTYISEFLLHVSNLAYHDRPDYKLCKEIFSREFQRLGFSADQMVLSVSDLRMAPPRPADHDEVDAQNVLSQRVMEAAKMMKMGMIMPFCETPSTPNQVSPKNLRSKVTQNTKKRRAKFSWTDILSTDPDQIARQRAEKEFEREEQCDQATIRRYTGKPTYAILQTESLKTMSKSQRESQSIENADDYIKGYTRSMMEVWRRRKIIQQFETALSAAQDPLDSKSNKKSRGRQRKGTASKTSSVQTSPEKSASGASAEDVRISNASDDALEMASPIQSDGGKSPVKPRRRRKSGLRHNITPTKKIRAYRETKSRRRKASASIATIVSPSVQSLELAKSPAEAATLLTKLPDVETTADTAIPLCDMSSKLAWWDIKESVTKNTSSSSSTIESSEASQSSNTSGHGDGVMGKRRRNYNSSCGMSSPASEEDSHESYDPFDYREPTKTRFNRRRGAHTTSKPLVISDEDSRDTTDYSPVKNRHKRTTKGSRKRRPAARVVSVESDPTDLIRTFTRG